MILEFRCCIPAMEGAIPQQVQHNRVHTWLICAKPSKGDSAASSLLVSQSASVGRNALAKGMT